MYRSYKEFNGYSTAFRQWRADSHCRYVHGYAIHFKVWFEGELDERNWVCDFGCFKRNGIKDMLKEMFDHTLCIAEDDPALDQFKELHAKDLCDLRIVPAVGCEKFAELIYNHVSKIVNNDRIWLESVEVKEHSGNGAVFKRQN